MNNSGKAAVAAGGASLAAIIALATQMIAPFEGKVNKPYLDPVGILTVCYGHTGKDIEKRPYTDAECLQLLETDVKTHATALNCVQTPYKLREGAAFVSLAYNIGVAGFCKSSAAKAANAGDYATACEKMKLHIKAKGKVLPGLVTRREFEGAICAGDFDKAREIASRKGFKALIAATNAIEAADIEEATDAEALRAAEQAASEAEQAASEAPATADTQSAVTQPASEPEKPAVGFLGGCTCSAC